MKKTGDTLQPFLGPQGPLNNEKYFGGVYRGNRGKGVDTGDYWITGDVYVC